MEHLLTSKCGLVKADGYLRPYIPAFLAETASVKSIEAAKASKTPENIPEHIIHITTLEMILLVSALRPAV